MIAPLDQIKGGAMRRVTGHLIRAGERIEGSTRSRAGEQ